MASVPKPAGPRLAIHAPDSLWSKAIALAKANEAQTKNREYVYPLATQFITNNLQ